MFVFKKRQAGSGRGTVAARQRKRWRMRPTLMALEDRRLLSTIVVNNPTDTPVTGKIDLRQAIVQANTKGGTETITFDSKVFKTQQTITLTHGELVLNDPNGRETITGPNGGRGGQRKQPEPSVPDRKWQCGDFQRCDRARFGGGPGRWALE